MKPKLSDFIKPEFVKFLLCNGFAALVNFLSRIVINLVLPFAVSVVLAYLVGMITAFVLNKLFVFKKSTLKTSRQLLGFTLVNVAAVLQTLGFSLLFRNAIFPAVGFTFYPSEVAHLIGVGIPVFTSFIGHKYFSFSQPGQEDDAA